MRFPFITPSSPSGPQGTHSHWPTWGLVWGLLMLPWGLQLLGHHWVRVADGCLLYVMLALGLNVVMGFTGLLDLGFVAFYALGAYLYAWLASPHLALQFSFIAQAFPDGLHTPFGLIALIAFVVSACAGVILGLPTLRLRGDYLAIATLAFGEIIRIMIINLDHPINLTDGARGLGQLDSINAFGWDLSKPLQVGAWSIAPVIGYYYLFLLMAMGMVLLCSRLHQSRIGRAWMAIREDETAAQSMGLPIHRLKLTAFCVGAGLGGLTGTLFASFQGFVSPEAFTLQESMAIVAMVVLGGMGHIPGVIAGAILLTALPEMLRYVAGPLQSITHGRLDAGMVRPTLLGLALVGVMLLRPQGLWPSSKQ